MGSLKEVQFSGCLGHHGSYSFFKYVKINGRVLSLSSFFPVRIYPDSAIFSIAEVQLLWSDRAENFVRLRLYFLPENTPEGRLGHHGEDEVIALQDKVIIRASDLSSWLVDESEWDWGLVLPTNLTQNTKSTSSSEQSHLKRVFSSDKFLKHEKVRDMPETESRRVLVLNYQRYVRVRTLLKRLEGSSDLSNWLSDPLVLALGGLSVSPNCRLLFSKEVFDYPELEDHELLCNHLAPKLKGRPRKRKRNRHNSLGSESNKSSSSATSACSAEVNKKSLNGILLISASVLELEKQSNLNPKSLDSDDSPEPSSPTEKASNITSGREEPVSETSGKKQTSKSTEDKVEASVTSNFPKRPKNGQLYLKARKEISSNDQISSSATEELAVEPTIELESTTIRVTSPPISNPPTVLKKSASSPPSPSETQIMEESDASRKMSPPKLEFLESSLLQLAEKLEKSNALQILPIRPSVITKQEPMCEMESRNSAQPSHIPRNQSIPDSPSVTVSEISYLQANQKPFATTDSKRNERRNASPVGESDKPRLSLTSSFRSSLDKVNDTNSIAPHPKIPVAHQVALSYSDSQLIYSNTLDAPGKPRCSRIEADFRRHKTLPLNYVSPSAFLPTRKMYGDPAAKINPVISQQHTLHQNDRGSRSNGVSSSSHAPSDGVLDFSAKRQKMAVDDGPQAALNLNVNMSVNLGSECLDLSVHKSQSSSCDAQVYHTISDIPPPNAVNQLGLRLTSEVTLFPSQQHQQKQPRLQSPHVQIKRTMKPDSNQQHKLYSNHQFSSPLQAHPQINHFLGTASRQRHLPDSSKRIPEYQPDFRSGSSTKLNSANVYNQSNHNPHVWRPASVTPAAPTGIVQVNSPTPKGRPREQGMQNSLTNGQVNRSKPSRMSSPVSMEQQTHPSGTVHGSPLKQNHVISPSFHHQHNQQLDERKEQNGNLNFQQLASAFGNFMLPPPVSSLGYPNPDPSFFSPFVSPFQLPPSALMRFGAMETLQLAYMQQGLSPHMANWAPPRNDSKGGSQK